MQIEKVNAINIPLEDAFASPASPEMAGIPLSPGKELLSVITSGALSWWSASDFDMDYDQLNLDLDERLSAQNEKSTWAENASELQMGQWVLHEIYLIIQYKPIILCGKVIIFWENIVRTLRSNRFNSFHTLLKKN